MQALTLTVEEIKDLAQAVGLKISDDSLGDDDIDVEYTIIECPTSGLDNEDGTFLHYKLIAFLTEYPEEGSFGLGKKHPTLNQPEN